MPNAENLSRCFFKGRFKCRLLVMRVAPVEGVGGAAEGEGEAVVEEGKAAEEAAEEAAAPHPLEPAAKRPRNRRAKRAGSIRCMSAEASAARCGEPVAGVGTVPSGPPALDAAGSVDDARSGVPAGP